MSDSEPVKTGIYDNLTAELYNLLWNESAEYTELMSIDPLVQPCEGGIYSYCTYFYTTW